MELPLNIEIQQDIDDYRLVVINILFGGFFARQPQRQDRKLFTEICFISDLKYASSSITFLCCKG